MNDNLLKRLEDYFSNEENSLYKGQPATDEQISNAEEALDIKFDKDYIEFIKLYGGSFVGLPVYAFSNSKMLSDQSIVDLTKEFRDAYREDDRIPIVQSSSVISIEGNGDPIMITPSGEILIYYHDNDESEIIADSFEQLIETSLP